MNLSQPAADSGNDTENTDICSVLSNMHATHIILLSFLTRASTDEKFPTHHRCLHPGACSGQNLEDLIVASPQSRSDLFFLPRVKNAKEPSIPRPR